MSSLRIDTLNFTLSTAQSGRAQIVKLDSAAKTLLKRHTGQEHPDCGRTYGTLCSIGIREMADYDGIIIGSGHNALVCALLLADAGWKVLVLERSAEIGGA